MFPRPLTATVLQPVSLGRLQGLWWCGPACRGGRESRCLECDGYGVAAKEFLERSWGEYRIRLKSSRNVMPPAAISGSW
jgi:hypothetical protein